ncbi:MAG: C1 family peptidase, partial [Candidatus Micrarchaeaceae archaeon]
GPIACYIDAGPIYDWGFGPNATEVFTHGVGHDNIDHVISVVGFGYDPAQRVDYWIIRNSWGEYWGAVGYFRLKMGDNQLGIETTPCAWAVPEIPHIKN